MTLGDIMNPATPLLDAKTYLAVIVGAYEIGTHYSDEYKTTANKMVFQFDIPSVKDASGNPVQLSKWLNAGRKKGCKFIEFFNSLDDKNYTEAEIRAIDPERYLGRACQIRVTVNTEKQKNYVESVMSLPDGIPAPQTSTKHCFYSVMDSGFSGAKWDALPGWVKNECEKSEQYRQNPPAQPLEMPEDEAPPELPNQSEPDEEDCPI